MKLNYLCLIRIVVLTLDVLLSRVIGNSNYKKFAPFLCARVNNQISRSPVFKAMLENEMEESRSGIIKIHDVSYDVLRSFVHYLYTAEVLLDEQLACDLLVLAEKYQVKHLKCFCEKFMTSKVNNDNALANYAFAHRHNAKPLLEAALSLIMDNMATLTERVEYKELVDEDPRLVVEIYEAYLTRQVNTAAKDSRLAP